MKKILVNLILLSCVFFTYAQREKTTGETHPNPAESLLMNIGGKIIDFTLPDSNFTEASNRYNSMFNLFVPANNRLICGYLTKGDMQKLAEGKDPEMESYILVEVSREAENLDCKPKDFKEVIASIGDVSNIITSSTDGVLKEVNDKLSSMNIQEIQLNDPKNLGVIFSKEDAIASGMIYKVRQGESVKTYIASILLMRIKERLVYVYLYKVYLNKTTVKAIVSLTDKYATSLLAANPPEQKEFLTNFWDGLPNWARNGMIGGGLGLLYALISSMFKRKKPEAVKVSQVPDETTDDENPTSE
jgi:hypothetical protein